MNPEKTWLLVPTERHVEAFAGASEPAHTLRKLIRTLALAEAPERAPTTPEMTRLMAAELLRCPIVQAKAFDDAVGKLRRAGTRAASLRAARLPRAERFAELLGRSDARLEELKLRDDREAAWLAAKRLAGNEHDVALEGGRAVIRGLSRWDGSTLCFIEALHAKLRREGGEGVCLELPELGPPPLRVAAHALAGQLETRWGEQNDHPTLALEPSGALEADRVTLVEAGDAASEARVAARAVLDALAAGVALERIAIVPVDLAEAFLEPLRFELSRARIPFVEPRGRPVIAAPRAHAALELVRLARGPIVRDGLIDVLRVPGLAVERWFSEEQIGELCHELAALPLRVERTPGELLTELDARFAAAPDAANEASFAKLRGGLARFLAELAELGASASREQHTARLSALFDGLALLEASPRTLSRALERAERGAFDLLQGLGHDAVAAASVRTALERSLAAARALGLHAETIPLHTWLQELELSLEGVAPARGAARAAAVRIARPDDVAALEMDLVVLCRASDASLDRGASLDATLGSEIEARLPAGERPPSALTEQHFTALSIACALSRAARVVITWSAREETATLAPSRLARALLAGRDPRREPASSLSPAAKRCVKLAAADDNATRRSQIELGRVDFYADPEHPLDAWNGAAGSLERFFGRDAARPIAVTTLERGLRCSFLAFANHVLRAARVDPMGDAIGVRERGSLLHEALAAALDATRADAANLTPEECVEHGIEAARAVLNRRGRSPLRRLGLRNTLSDVRAVLNFVFRTNDGLAFRRAEQGFGENLEWRPLAVGPWQLSGRIDRIDATSDGRRARVIDYKTRTPGKSDDALALQPWLYAQKAALEMGATNVEFCFLGVDRREPRLRVVYDGPADGEAIQNAQQRASEMLLSLEAGRVAARPASSAFCVRCDARDICRRPLSAPSPESADE